MIKRHVCGSKYDPLVDEAELVEANPQYAHVRLNDGRETTVSLRDLAPYSPSTPAEPSDLAEEPSQLSQEESVYESPSAPETSVVPPVTDTYIIPPRRSTRTSNPPSRLIEGI